MLNILIGTPAFDGRLMINYVASLLQLQEYLRRERIEFGIELFAGESLITRARNYFVARMLQNPSFSHLLFIDADIGFDPRYVRRYINADKDIVAGVYPLKELNLSAIRSLRPGQPETAAMRYAVEPLPGAKQNVDGLIEVTYAATGFMLIKRHVLEKMAKHYSDLKYSRSFSPTPSSVSREHLFALFDTSVDRERGHYLPEDYTFCNRWRAIGGEIWADARGKFTHFGSYEYRGDFAAWGGLVPTRGS
jgi:hypothetical protein